VHETQRLLVYPAARSFSAVMSQGLEPPIFTGSFIAVEHPDSYNEHDVIGQFVVSELLKKTFQEVHELDMILTSSEVVDESYDTETDSALVLAERTDEQSTTVVVTYTDLWLYSLSMKSPSVVDSYAWQVPREVPYWQHTKTDDDEGE
jgi:hypothetical protein